MTIAIDDQQYLGQYAPDFTGEYPPALAGHGTTFAPVQQPGPDYSPSNPLDGLSVGDSAALVGYATGAVGAFAGYRMAEDLPTSQRLLAALVGLVGAGFLGALGTVLVRR